MLEITGLITIPTAGTRIALIDQTLLTAVLGQFKTCQAVNLQAWHANTGRIFIGKSTLVAATGVGVGHVLAIPISNFIPSFGIANVGRAAGVDLSIIYLDASVSGEGVLVTLLIT